MYLFFHFSPDFCVEDRFTRKKGMMDVYKFIILTLLTSFVSAAYCQMGDSSSETICNITIYKDDGTDRGVVVNVWQSKLIDKCPENYKNQDIITSCEHFNALESFNTDLFTPVTNNNITNITYANTFCGYCNGYNGTKWKGIWWSYWSPMYKLYVEDACDNYNYTSKIKASEVNDLDKWTQTFINNGMALKTKLLYQKMECFGKKDWPVKLLDTVIPCLVENYMSGQGNRLKSCQYFDKNDRSCMRMKFIIEGLSYPDDGYKAYYRLSQINLTGGDYVVQTGNDDIFYMCKQIYKVGYWGKFALIIASVAFLLIYLILNFNKRYFQILPNQLLCIYSIGLIAMYVLLTYIYLKFPISYVSFYVAKIFWTYHFIWVTLISIVFCHMAFSKCNRCRIESEGATNIFYVTIQFLFGLLLPISLAIMYLNFLNSHENQCPLIPGHLGFTDIPSGNLQFMKSILNGSFGFFMPAMFLVGLICLLCNKGSSGEGRSARYTENSPIVLLKMLLIMGVHYVVYKHCLEYYGNEKSYTVIGLAINMDTVAQLSIDIHGVLVFFVFLTDNAMFNDILIKRGYKRGNTTRQINDGATETTVQFQS